MSPPDAAPQGLTVERLYLQVGAALANGTLSPSDPVRISTYAHGGFYDGDAWITDAPMIIGVEDGALVLSGGFDPEITRA